VRAAPTWERGFPSLQLWLVTIGLTHGLDILTTAIGLRLGIPEDNPFMSSVLHRHGELAMYGMKILIVVGLVFAVVRLRGRYQRAWTLMLAMTVPVFLVVVHNLALIAEAHG
jgi:hypothetical protein